MKITPHRSWLAVFALWSLFLSGALAGLIGSPGVIQAVRLNGLLKSKEDQVLKYQDSIVKLQAEADLLEKSRTAQQREIRKSLGYASSDEIIFYFSEGDRL